jgi:NDP-mannose synthase
MTEGVFSLSEELTARTRRRAVKAVVLAGGRGTRLAPYTSVLPKPLMPIGDRSILELVLGQLTACRITDVTLCVGYLSHLIEAVLENRPEDGVQISYVREQEALGTAAPLRHVAGLDSTFIAMNGDVLTTLDYRALIRSHRRSGNLLTIATRDRPIQIDYGVLHLGTNGHRNRVEAYVEKPQMTSTVSMGIYVLEPEALGYIPPTGRCDFPDLVQSLLQNGERVGAYRYNGLWFDIGRREDYEQAVAAWIEATGQGSSSAPSPPNATATARAIAAGRS